MSRFNPFQCLVARVLRESDSADARHRKQLWIPLLTVSIPAVLLQLVNSHNSTQYKYRAVWHASAVAAVVAVAALLYPLLTRSLSKALVANICVIFGACALAADWGLAAAQSPLRTWTFVVLIMDVFLGLFDIPNWTDQRTDWHEQCADPPCAIGLLRGMAIAVMMAIVFHIDYFATRSFAENLRREQAITAAAIAVADQVAADLAQFDLVAAEGALTDAKLPPRLMSSFHCLLRNLSSYRPYLPESCLYFGGADLSSASGGDAVTDSKCSSSVSQLHHSLTAPRVSPRSSGRPSFSSAHGGLAGGFQREAHAPQQRGVTLLLCNRCGFLAGCAQTDVDRAREWVAAEVERFSAVVRTLGGTSDLLSADHLSASFGAVKVRGSHRSAATRAAWSLADAPGDSVVDPAPGLTVLRSTAAVCSGRALCGDFGSAAAQRFMVIGVVSSFVFTAERVAAAWGIGALVDAAVHADTEQFWNCRLLKKAATPQRTVSLWEVVGERLHLDGPQSEWMYELGQAVPNPWERYNAVLLQWYDGTLSEGLLEACADPEPSRSDSHGSAAAEVLGALLSLIRDGGEAPVGDFTPEGFYGDPAPARPSRRGSRSPAVRVEPVTVDS
eukprot:TRINITY_DN10051_c0_g1_i3.p1 TRINITY_DN10051_c0_g1~~TRINITY_DN10051_c0_g1_i3.p1  ORF type:complete len:643 (+),score=112.78 TRINITY_DN10051_c0_g1_i3:89-1930(+)